MTLNIKIQNGKTLFPSTWLPDILKEKDSCLASIVMTPRKPKTSIQLAKYFV